MRLCVICGEEMATEAGVPCTFCDGWFHLGRNTTTDERNCGQRSLNFLAEGVCGTLYLCRTCEERLAARGDESEPVMVS